MIVKITVPVYLGGGFDYSGEPYTIGSRPVAKATTAEVTEERGRQVLVIRVNPDVIVAEDTFGAGTLAGDIDVELIDD